MIKGRSICFVIFLIGILWPCMTSSTGFAVEDRLQSALQGIDENTVRAHVKFLADDLLEGRGTGSRGEHLAVRYIASQMEAIGLLPGGEDGSYFQKVPMVGTAPDPSMTLRFHINNRVVPAIYSEEFIAIAPLQREEMHLKEAELVFVGFGIQAPEYEWDDYKGADLRGKVLLFLNNDPDTGDPQFFGGKARLYYGRWTYKYEMAAKMGAAGALIIHTNPSAGYPWRVVQSSWSGETFALPLSEPAPEMQGWITEEKIEEILKTADINLSSLYDTAQKKDFRPRSLGIRVSIDIQSTIRRLEGINVLGLLPGSDPRLKEEAVVFTAHHDHLGIGDPVDGDSIYNGALDNASGIACMLSAAKALAGWTPRPKRSILFVTVTAEESGLLGSAYYAKHPTFPTEKIAVTFNMDGTNILGRTKDLVVLGFGKTDLDDPLQNLAALQGRVVLPDQMPEKGSFYRSDHFSFAKTGIPSLSFETGLDVIGKPEGWGKAQVDEYTEKHYHQPSDEYDPAWNLEGAIEDTRLIFQLALQIANQEAMPKWKPGDEFEKIRNP